MSKKRVFVGISGGVDSALSAWLLQNKNYDVHAVFMKNWREDFFPSGSGGSYCTQDADLNDAIAVCEHLSISLEVLDFSEQYYERVFSYFLDEYRKGRTPNPDVLCNSYIKFDSFLNYALSQGADGIATGHYARIECGGGGVCRLLKGIDSTKDQSYFLYRLNQHQLKHALFPLGDIYKSTVRKLAFKIGLPNAGKPDSTGICFIGERPFREFLMNFIPAQPGPIYTLDGRYLGQHQGLMFHTIGQRRGLGIGGVRGCDTSQAWYVVSKDIERNALIVCMGEHHPSLYRESVNLVDLSWINDEPSNLPSRYSSQIRYHQPDQLCTYHGSDKSGTGSVAFVAPQRAVAPGQSLVLYDGAICLGGGVICP
ncbi:MULTISPECIES: tRNA 2-thiouridine(34) synthase MnmA [Candidatus Ichthyocystis]|uniref:tRNA-specific 2-thiouridylase MnmA n=1 Tax=Candidatus Ichthyocystis hellenicum TaxID=1561003 RepID=A0A0S4LZF4_9BURK|nr:MULTISPECIES: tRNA 2-thiouridine(34) synthase MnmA [Ichthyocystis]CUT16953.1 tRNA-specific 2-thiouridylase mnmA [Candidatus Ichthyocystis hellenicum]